MALTEYTTMAVSEETAYATVPAVAAQLINCRNINFTEDRTTQTPQVYTGDRRTFPSRIVDTGGTFTFEAPQQYENALLLFEGLASADRGAAISVTGTDISVATNVLSQVAAGLGSFAKGMWVYLSGAGISPNTAGWYGPIIAASASSLTFPTGQLSNFSAGGSVTIRTRQLKDGTDHRSYSAQWQATDLANQFRRGSGFRVQSLQETWELGNFATQNWSLMGKAPIYSSSTISTGAALAAPTSDYKTSVLDFKGNWIANGATGNGITTASSLIVTRIQAQIQNTLVPVKGLGSLGPSDIEVGTMSGSSLQVTARFDDAARTAIADLVDSHTTMAAAWAMDDPNGNHMLRFFPALRPDKGDAEFGPPSSIRYIPVTFSIHDPAKDASSAYTSLAFGFQWSYFWVPA